MSNGNYWLYDNDDDYDDCVDHFHGRRRSNKAPECYRCGEICYWEGGELYDMDVDLPHVCGDRIMATADDFED